MSNNRKNNDLHDEEFRIHGYESMSPLVQFLGTLVLLLLVLLAILLRSI